jgi:hypothetical protein
MKSANQSGDPSRKPNRAERKESIMPSKEIEVVAQAQRRAEAISNVGPRRDVIQIVPPRGMVRRSDLREADLGGGFLGDDVPDEAFWETGVRCLHCAEDRRLGRARKSHCQGRSEPLSPLHGAGRSPAVRRYDSPKCLMSRATLMGGLPLRSNSN